jgi:hypothetical protein
VTTAQSAATWPGIADLREQFADQAWGTAQQMQEENGWSDEETIRMVHDAATHAAGCIASALIEAAEMGLDEWKLTR